MLARVSQIVNSNFKVQQKKSLNPQTTKITFLVSLVKVGVSCEKTNQGECMSTATAVVNKCTLI